MVLRYPFPDAPRCGVLEAIAPGIFWARLPLPFRLDHVNVYVVEDYDGWAVIDTGIDDLPTRSAWQALLAGPLSGKRLSRLIVTHHHPDHMGLAGWLGLEHGAPLMTSQTAFLSYRDIAASDRSGERTDLGKFYRSHGMTDDLAAAVSTQGGFYLSMVTELPASFVRVVAGDSLDIGGRRFDVLSGDGHAPEQLMLASAELGLLFAADQVMERISPNVGVSAIDPHGDPLGLYLRSLDSLRRLEYDPLVLPGHHRPFRGLRERCLELVAHHEERCAYVEDAVREGPRTVAEIVPHLFSRELDPHQTRFAFSECHAHVNHMIGKRRLEWVEVRDAGKVIQACQLASRS